MSLWGASNSMAYFINNYGKSPEVIFYIDVVNIKSTTESVHIFMEKDAVGSDCHDCLSLIKLDKVLAVIENIFHQLDKLFALNNPFIYKVIYEDYII